MIQTQHDRAMVLVHCNLSQCHVFINIKVLRESLACFYTYEPGNSQLSKRDDSEKNSMAEL